MSEDPPAVALDALLAESRAVREALQTLIERMRREREDWERMAAHRSASERLTPAQRQLFGRLRPPRSPRDGG